MYKGQITIERCDSTVEVNTGTGSGTVAGTWSNSNF